MQVRGVDFILLSVADTKRAVGFYRDTLGLKPAAEWPPHWYEFDAGATTIAIAKPPPDEPQAPYTQNGVTFALAVPNAKAAMEELRGKGVKVLKEVEESKTCAMGLITDPDGNMIWLHQRMDGTFG